MMGKKMALECMRVIFQDLYPDVLYFNKKSSQKGQFQECHLSPWKRQMVDRLSHSQRECAGLSRAGRGEVPRSANYKTNPLFCLSYNR